MLRCLYSLLIGGTAAAGEAAISPECLTGDKRASKQLVDATCSLNGALAFEHAVVQCLDRAVLVQKNHSVHRLFIEC